MAAGDVVSVAIGTDGWWADVTFSGMATGGTYLLGLGTNNEADISASPRLVLTVVSLGFDTSGNATTVTRTLYGTKQVRKPYPDHATNQESNDGTNTTVRIALSDYVFAKDFTGAGNSGTAPTATLLAGLYASGGTTSAAASNVPVTNNSTRAYPKVVGNWSWPGYDKLGSSFPLRAVAFHSSAAQGRPVQCVKFTATDGTSTATSTVASPTVDSAVGDALPVVEYVATMDGSGFTQGSVVTANFVAYPRIGDAAACLDTSAGTAPPSNLYGPQRYVCDRTGAYCTTTAVVDPVNGNDSTGVVAATFNPASPPASFATIAAAFTAVRTANNTTYSRNNAGGSTVYLREGSHAWIGGTVTVGTAPDVNILVTRFPGTNRDNVNIASKSGGGSIGNRLKISGVTITGETTAGLFALGSASHLWIDQCVINSPTANRPLAYTCTVWHVTRTACPAFQQGFGPFSNDYSAPGIIRGNTVTTMAPRTIATTLLGNILPCTTNVTDSYTGMTIPEPANTIVAYNRMSGAIAGNAPVLLRAVKTETHGLAFVQNLIEVTATASSAAVQISADSTTQTPVNNVLVWNNTVVGQRVNLAYNEVDALAVRLGWSVRNNIFDDANIKSDTFSGSGYTPNGAKIGNWSLLYGAGCSGNFYIETAGIGAPGNFLWEIPGLRSYQPALTAGSQPPSSPSNTLGFEKFVDRRSYNGSATGAGGGDYHLQPSSPAVALQRSLVMPLDMAGQSRAASDAPGAFANVAAEPPPSSVVGATAFFAA